MAKSSKGERERVKKKGDFPAAQIVIQNDTTFTRDLLILSSPRKLSVEVYWIIAHAM